jgi:hypothetical protein
LETQQSSVIWVLKELDVYLKGRHLTVIIDHKPLVSIFDPTKSTIAADQLQHWALLLAVTKTNP